MNNSKIIWEIKHYEKINSDPEQWLKPVILATGKIRRITV
jgi:hypothetical protein